MHRFARIVTMLALVLLGAPASATVPTATSTSGPYACDGSYAVSFIVGFKFFANSDLVVKTTSAAGVEATLAYATDYTVTGPGLTPFGTVTLVAASRCPDGSTLTIKRVVPLTQTTSLGTQGQYNPKVIETALDRITMALQQAWREQEELRSGGGGGTGLGLLLPAPQTGRFLRWKANGTLENATVSDLLDSIAGATPTAGERYWIDTSGVIVPTDTTAPIITAFAIPSPRSSLVVPITSLTASDAVGVTGYLVTETAASPTSGAPGWVSPAPASFTFPSAGTKTLYAFAKDAAGNVSSAASATTVITLTDTTAPVVTSFTMASTATVNQAVTGISIAASDAYGATGYYLTTSSTKPLASGSFVLPLTQWTFTNAGTFTMYPWARDLAGNVSNVYGSPVTVTVSAPADTTAPVIASFAATPGDHLNVNIAISATDAVGVTGYLLSETGTTPAPGAGGWVSSAPTSFTVLGYGTHTVYAWAKDAAGNVSNRAESVVTATNDSELPVVTSFTLGAPTTVVLGGSTGTISIVATDNVGVTHCHLTSTSTPPLATDGNWFVNCDPGPTLTASSGVAGPRQTWAWVKDAAGNVSAPFAPVNWTATEPAPVTEVTFIGAGAPLNVEGTGADALAAPANTQAGDILIVIANDTNGVPGFTQFLATSGKTAWWRRATGPQDPVVLATNSDDGQGGPVAIAARMFAWRGCVSAGDPIAVPSIAKAYTQGTATMAGAAVTVPADAALVFAIHAGSGDPITGIGGGAIDTRVTADPATGMRVEVAYDATPTGANGATAAPTMTFAAHSVPASVAAAFTFALRRN
jgi:hypothetical protein